MAATATTVRLRPMAGRKVLVLAAAVGIATGTASCGGLVPMPVQPTPLTAEQHESSPRLMLPPNESLEGDGTGGLCGTDDIGWVTMFGGHANARDGRHYHRWLPPGGAEFWVVC